MWSRTSTISVVKSTLILKEAKRKGCARHTNSCALQWLHSYEVAVCWIARECARGCTHEGSRVRVCARLQQ